MNKTIKEKLNRFKAWFDKNRVITFIVDFLFVSFICGVYLIEYFRLIPACITYNVSLDIIISLVPAVITIISISIQAQNDKIRGISIREFNKTRTSFYYSLTHMLLVFVGIFAIEAILLLFNLRVMLLSLDAISLIYSVIFLLQEMPILTKSDKKIDRILRKYPFSRDGLNQERQDVRFDMLTNTVMDIGIIDAFNRWKNKNSKNDADLLLYLLSISTIYYSKVLANLTDKDSKETIKYYDIDIIKAIDNSFSDIEYLLNKNNKINIGVVPKDENGVFFLTRLTYSLHDICGHLNYQKKFASKLQDLINELYLLSYQNDFNSNRTMYQYLILMSIFTLKNGKVWFTTAVRDRTFPPYFFDINENPLTFLLSMYMCFVLSSRYASDETKETISHFLNEESKGPNSAGFKWKDKLKSSLHQSNNGKNFLGGCLKLIKIKQLYDSFYFEIRPENGGVYTIDDSTSFSDELVFDYCLQILLYNHYYDVTSEDIKVFINSLPKESAVCFRRTFEYRWRKQDGKINNSLTFYNFVFDDSNNYKYFNDSIYNCIEAEINKINREEYFNDDSNKLNDNHLKSIKSLVDAKVPSVFEKIQFVDASLDENGLQKKYFGILLEGPDYDQLLSSYINHLEYSINNLIKEAFLDAKKPIVLKGDTYDAETIDTIIAFKPNYYSDSYRLFYNASDEQRSEISGFTRITNGMLPHDTYIKNGAVKIRIDYCKEDSSPRRLNRKEVEDIIDRDYPVINGYYRFNKYKGSNFGDFFVTRDELVELLLNKYIFVPIVFDIKIVISKKDILFYSFKEE